METKPLTHKQEKFALAVVATGNQTEAYRRAYNVRAGTEPEVLTNAASGLMRNADIAARVAQLREAAAAVAVMESADVLKRWIQIATADPNEIVQHQRVCCRYCYGVGFSYQWQPNEYAEACDKALRDEKEIPDCLGDYYDATLAPHPKCPECHGEGDGVVHIADSRELTGAARLLYAGVKWTKYGPEVLLRDQDAALEKIAKNLGMLKDALQLTQPDVAAATVAAASSPADAMKSYLQLINATNPTA